MTKFHFEAIGTAWNIEIPEALSPEKENELLARVRGRIGIFDEVYSRFRADSLVTLMSREPGTFELPPDAKPMMLLYRDLYLRTGGLVTPLIGNLISDAGYDAKYSLVPKKELHAVPEWDDILSYDYPMITLRKPVILDFGAAGKGYLIDLVGRVFEENGVSAYFIEAGGDILQKGSKPARVGLEHPDLAGHPGEAVGVCDLQNKSICGSAGNRRAWADFTHIINPKTLRSPKEILAVWVVAETALVADGLATALFFVPARTLADGYDFEYAIVRADYSIEKSEHFPGESFTSRKREEVI